MIVEMKEGDTGFATVPVNMRLGETHPDEFYTPRPSIECRTSLQTDEMHSCRSSLDPPFAPFPFMPAPTLGEQLPPERQFEEQKTPPVELGDLIYGATPSTDLHSSASGPTTVPEASFTIRNLMTGEAIDLRDENEADFGLRLAGLLTLKDGEVLTQHL
jgi:hypothetical protein